MAGKERTCRLLIVPLVLFGCLLLASCTLLPEEDRPMKPPLLKPAARKTVTAEAAVRTIEKKITGSAIFESVKSRHHQFTLTGGRVGEIVVRAGDQVKAGDVLLRLEMGDLTKESLRKRLDVEKKLLGLDEAKAAANSRKVRIAELELEIARIELDEVTQKIAARELKAETDGTVVYVAEMLPGDAIEPYQTLVTVADPSELRLSLQLADESLLMSASAGMTAEIEINSSVYHGKVVQTPATTPYEEDERLRQKNAKTLYLSIESAPGHIEIGDMANVSIVTARSENAVIIPKGGLRKYFGRTFVQVLEGESRREIDVEAGLETASEVEIVKGLEAGQLVILQ